MEESLVPLPAPAGTPVTPELIQRLRSAALFTTLAGAAYAVLFIVSFWLMLEVPRQGATDSEIESFYTSSQSSIVSFVALYLLPFAGIAFLWFIVTLRMWITLRAVRPVNLLFSNVQFVSGIIFLTLLFAAAAALSIGPVSYEVSGVLSAPYIAREFPLFGGSLFFVFATRMGAMFVFSTTRICSEAAIIPRWFAMVGIAVGIVLLLTSSFNRWMILVFPLWVLALCILAQLHVRKIVQEKTAALAETDPPNQADNSQ